MIGWDDPRTALAYEAFARVHDRYDVANRHLVSHARLQPDHSVLDLGAGTGRTAEHVLASLGLHGRVVCVEPADAMRVLGEERLSDPRVTWSADVVPGDTFDRVVCGAAIWLLRPFEETFARIHALLRPGGIFAFDIPSLYLGEPDEPGGGDDPLLLLLAAEIAEGRVPKADPTPPMSRGAIERALTSAGFAPTASSFRVKLTQAMLRDWMKIPVIMNALLSDLEPDARAARIDAAYARCDAGSWRWEQWSAWSCALTA